MNANPQRPHDMNALSQFELRPFIMRPMRFLKRPVFSSLALRKNWCEGHFSSKKSSVIRGARGTEESRLCEHLRVRGHHYLYQGLPKCGKARFVLPLLYNPRERKAR